MTDARTHLDELVTASTNFRAELASEITERVELLQEQVDALAEAAAILSGKPVETRRTSPDVSEELAAEHQKVQRLIAEVQNLRQRLHEAEQRPSVEPLSQALREREEEVQEARELANARGRELEAALVRIGDLERQLHTAQERIQEAITAAEQQPTPAPSIPEEWPQERFLGTVMLKDSGPKGAMRPVFALPRGNRTLYEQGIARLQETFQVYYLEDGTVVYKPTGVRAEEAPTPAAKPAPEEPPEYGDLSEEDIALLQLARSPKPVAEMRSHEVEKELRLGRLVQHLVEHNSHAPFNSSDLAEDLGRVEERSAVKVDLDILAKRNIVSRTGKMSLPRAVIAAREAKGSHIAGGRPALLFALDEALRKDPEVGDTQARVRDYMVDVLVKGTMISPVQVADALELPTPAVLEALESLAQRGILNDASPSEDMRLFAYAGKPTTPGKAAELDALRRSEGNGDVARSSPVAGTGTGTRAANKDVQDLIRAAERAGARVRHEASGHFAVTIPGSGKRILISSTPSSPRSVLNDRARLRKAGLQITS